jgi:glutathione S-transferase
MIATIERAIAGGEWLLGDMFTIADVVFGGTIDYMLRFKMLDASPALTAYAERLRARPAFQRANARNAAVVKEHGLAV